MGTHVWRVTLRSSRSSGVCSRHVLFIDSTFSLYVAIQFRNHAWLRGNAIRSHGMSDAAALTHPKVPRLSSRRHRHSRHGLFGGTVTDREPEHAGAVM